MCLFFFLKNCLHLNKQLGRWIVGLKHSLILCLLYFCKNSLAVEM